MTAENFANAVHEPMDLTKIASKLRSSISTLSEAAAAAAAAASGQHECNGGDSNDRPLTVSTKDNEASRSPLSCGVEEEEDDAAAVAAAAVAAAVAVVPSPDAAGGSACDGGGGGGGGGVAPYANVPAFTKDMRLVFENVRRMWPHGSIGGDNRLTKAADSLKTAFEERWNALAPRVHSIQVSVGYTCVGQIDDCIGDTFGWHVFSFGRVDGLSNYAAHVHVCMYQ